MSRFGYSHGGTSGVHEESREEDMALGSFQIKSRTTLEKEEEEKKRRLRETMLTCPLCGTTNSLDKYATCRCLQHDKICPSCRKSWHYCRLQEGKVRTDHPCALGCGDWSH